MRLTRSTLTLLAALICCRTQAHAQMAEQPKVRQVRLGNLTNCNASAINSAVNCEVRCTGTSCINGEVLTVQGFNLLTLQVFYDYSAGTGYEFYLQACNEGSLTTNCTDATDWYRVLGETTSAGDTKLEGGRVYRTVSADDYHSWSIGINYFRLRLQSVVATGTPDANDKITVYATLGVSPGL